MPNEGTLWVRIAHRIAAFLTRLVAAQNPGVPFWDLVRLSIYLSKG